MVLAFPNASNNVLACTNLSFTSFVSLLSPETSTKNCNTILAVSVFPDPLSPAINSQVSKKNSKLYNACM